MAPARTTKHKLTVFSAVALSLAAAGCSKLTIVGVSGKQGAENATPLTKPAQRTATEIAAIRGELLQPYVPELGDINGDGYDDFLLGGSAAEDAQSSLTAYLFYGRPTFEEQLVSSDADATFETRSAVGLGDINGDGLADFGLQSRDGYELIFGSKTRWTGPHAKLSSGTVVTYEAVAGIDGLDAAAIEALLRVGDLNGDGKDELVVRVVAPDAVHGNFYGTGSVEYILPGRADGWPTGKWDENWAVAKLGVEVDPVSDEVTAALSVLGSGDLDGDSYDDLLVYNASTTLLYYGGPEGLKGALTAASADAELDYGSTDFPVILGDLDGDGAIDLGLQQPEALKITYGSSTRFAKRVHPQPDLTFVGKTYYLSALVGDLNGDGLPDLVYVANRLGSLLVPLSMRLYVELGTGKRLTGEQRGTDTWFQPVGYTAPDVLTADGGFYALPGGDFDGDGSTDLMLGAPNDDVPADSLVYLLPGSMREPE